MDPLSEIKKLYFNATASTIQRDLTRAIDLLKGMSDDDARQDAAVYMDGLAEMRSEWNQKGSKGSKSSKSAAPASVKRTKKR